MKCNAQSSTEMELISIPDKLPDIIWTRYFIECQEGYDIDAYIVFQDNMSSLSLEKNKREYHPRNGRSIFRQSIF